MILRNTEYGIKSDRFYDLRFYDFPFFYNIDARAQRQIPENFRFLELKILFVVEATPIEEKN